MDQGALVDSRVEDGRRLLAQLAADAVEVTAAAWVRTSEDGQWHLYLATPVVEAEGLRAAYGRLHAALTHVPSPWLTLSELAVVGATSPFAQHVQQYYRQFGGVVAARYRSPRLGDLAIEEAYLYPRPGPPTAGVPAMTTDEVVHKMTTLLTQSGSLRPSTIYLRDHSSFQGIPAAVERSNEHLTLRWVDSTTGKPRDIPAADVISIT